MTRGSLVGLASLLFALAARGESAGPLPIDKSLPPVFYTQQVKSETVDSRSPGIVVGLVGEAYRAAHEKFLVALQSRTDADATGFQRHLACIGVADPDRGCRRLVRQDTVLSADALKSLLRAEPSRSALVLETTIIFDGRFFQVPTYLREWHLNDQGVAELHRETGASYIATYSKSQHQADIDQKRNDSPFSGTLGSKEARTHYWLGGTHPRLPTVLDESFRLIADLYSAALAPGATGILAGDDSGRKSLPRVKDVVGTDKSRCATLHGDFRVARDLGEYFWLVFPSSAKAVRHTFYIEPRCGFDY